MGLLLAQECLCHGGGCDGLFALLLFGGERLAQPVDLLGVRRGGAAGLVGLPGPGLLFLQLTTEVGELVLLVAGLLVEFGDAGGRGGRG
ncbi:hypothetical protein HII36_23830 [Nonomuraea sp. NN258]|uniref:hypothetical protein n=1 Tax=Nonomuraea antri TaxID=2730852 RepID=UPI0015696AEC|nr:hypothetical protein [Nonomuraea antri]NRQ34841.1 hypothetical protein [Nonomuraea antri]